MGKRVRLLLVAVLAVMLIAGCEKETESTERGKDWDYTVVAVRDCPEDFLKELEEKKVNA